MSSEESLDSDADRRLGQYRDRQPSDDELADRVAKVRAEILAVHIKLGSLDRPVNEGLKNICQILRRCSLSVADLGEAAFDFNSAHDDIAFNVAHLRKVVAVVRQLFSGAASDLPALEQEATRLFVLHELEHIDQHFVEHSLAAEMKDAFGPDEVSKLDVVADVRAAHCSAIIADTLSGSTDPIAHLRRYRNYLILSYQILCVGFGVDGLAHKKKRALGLLTNASIAQLAIRYANAPEQRLFSTLAFQPTFTSVSQETGRFVILALSTRGWRILTDARFRQDTSTVLSVWNGLGGAGYEYILAVLGAAVEGAVLELPLGGD